MFGSRGTTVTVAVDGMGRWPANILHDGSNEVLAAFPVTGKSPDPSIRSTTDGDHSHQPMPGHKAGEIKHCFADERSASRFFYSAKATRAERNGSRHPTVKPIALMRWLVRLVAPEGGMVLDPFAGSGTTGAAAIAEGRRIVMIEREAEYAADIRRRMAGDDAAPPLEVGKSTAISPTSGLTLRGGGGAAGTAAARSGMTPSAASQETGRRIGPMGLKR